MSRGSIDSAGQKCRVRMKLVFGGCNSLLLCNSVGGRKQECTSPSGLLLDGYLSLQELSVAGSLLVFIPADSYITREILPLFQHRSTITSCSFRVSRRALHYKCLDNPVFGLSTGPSRPNSKTFMNSL